jgi:hypothetical protein
MEWNRTRLAGQALIAGGTLAIAGYASAATFAGSSGNKRFTSPLWMPLNGIAIAGSILCLLGLPAILALHGTRAPRLTLIGYVGSLLTVLRLNIGEGTTETFVKPYLATHGGLSHATSGTGWNVYFLIAFLSLFAGLISLGIAVIRARVCPWWVGALLIASAPLSFVQALPGPLALLGDYLAFSGFIAIGCKAVAAPRPDHAPSLMPSLQVGMSTRP